jgi:hypothetical protein
MNAEPFPPSATTSVITTDLRAKAGAIDPTSGIAASHVYLYSGTLDSTVNPKVMNALNEYYLNYIPATNVLYGRCLLCSAPLCSALRPARHQSWSKADTRCVWCVQPTISVVPTPNRPTIR